MKQGVLIPVYRHGRTAYPLAQRLASSRLPVILVDDGNDTETQTLLAECAAQTPGVTLVRLEKNTGKGGAFIKGLEKAQELGLTHVLQMDADGQHDVTMAEFFLEQAVKYPGRIVCGFPEFDETAPQSRVIGRKISVFWAAIVTLSSELKDTHCGFRVYPVDETLRITRNPFLDKRMGFDTEILVRLYWNKVRPVFFPIKIHYPADGVSNFRVVRDNIRISWVFTRLCAGMLLRLPFLTREKLKMKREKR
jgi:glycosyltransferase involved in cell wall biosynthesis